MPRVLFDIQPDIYKHVQKLQFTFLMMSCLQRSQNSLGSFVAFLKIACLHVSFAAYESFYKQSKYALSSQLLSTFSPSEASEIRNQKPNNQTYIDLYTGSLLHNYICGRALSGDPLSIIMPFCMTRA